MAGSALAAPAQAAKPAPPAFDARGGHSASAPGQEAKALRKALGDQGLLDSDPRTGTVRAAGKLDGALTGPSRKPAADVALGYVREHGRALGLPQGQAPGLALEARTVTGGGMEVLTWRQRRGGIPAADTYLRAAVDADGRLLSLTGAPAADLAPPTLTPAITAAAALTAVSGSPAPKGKRRGNDPELHTTFAGGATASLVLYQGGDGARLGWRVVAPLGPGQLADAIVDAADGSVVERANRVKAAAPGDALVFPFTPDAGPQQTRSLSQWGTETGRLLGTRVHAFADPSDVVGTGPAPVAPSETTTRDAALQTYAGCGEPGEKRCTWIDGTPLANVDQSATQLYWHVNTFLDRLAAQPIGYTDATGGFGPGDRIHVQAMDGALVGQRDNASFVAYPDGGPGLMEVHLFGAFDMRLDGANDPSLVYHEVAHGLSERLVTDGQGVGALNEAQAWAIGEGTSDFYALDYLVEQGFETPPVKFGAYLGNWLRTTPIDGDTLAYGPLSGEGHEDGEIIAQTLWSLRELVGSVAARRLLTDALRIAPPEPSFLDLRNALLIVSAAQATDEQIWQVFAARGMGYFASSQGATDEDPHADAVDPYDPPDGLEHRTLEGVVRDEDGRPVAGAVVQIGEPGGGVLGPFLSAITGSDGHYVLQAYEGRHALVSAAKAAYAPDAAEDVVIDEDGGEQNFTLSRDFSSSAGGAAVENFTGQDNSAFGCGPGGLIDDAGETVWSTDRGAGARAVVIDLGATVDVATIRVDPAAGCGDDDASALGTADVLVAGAPDTPFAPLSSPTFVAGDLGHLKPVFSGTRTGVRFVKLVAKTAQSTAGTGADFIDAAELQVLKKPGTPVGPTADTGGATAIGPTGATLLGTVAPNGGAAPAVVFEYGTTPAYGGLVAASGSPGAHAAVTGLEPSTTYHYRVVALRDGRRYEGGNATFTTGPAPPPPPPSTATSATIVGRRVTASRKGTFRIKVRFAAGAPEGPARAVARRGGKVVARGKRAVVPGATRRITMRLTRAGRKAIPRGSSRKVKIVLHLPEGEPVRKSLTIARKR